MHLTRKIATHTTDTRKYKKERDAMNIQSLKDNCLVEVMGSMMKSSSRSIQERSFLAGRIGESSSQGISITCSASFPLRKPLQDNSTFKQNQSVTLFFITGCEDAVPKLLQRSGYPL